MNIMIRKLDPPAAKQETKKSSLMRNERTSMPFVVKIVQKQVKNKGNSQNGFRSIQPFLKPTSFSMHNPSQFTYQTNYHRRSIESLTFQKP